MFDVMIQIMIVRDNTKYAREICRIYVNFG